MATKIPPYKRHANGQAYICHPSIPRPGILYLGKYDSEISHLRYQQAVDRIIRGMHLQTVKASESASVAEIALEYMDHVEQYYVDDDGKKTAEVGSNRDALLILVRIAGHMLCSNFGPSTLIDVRESMIDMGWARSTINKHVGRVKRMFRWASQLEKIPPTTYHGLVSVDGLRRGRSRAKETEPVKPVAWKHVEAILPYLSPTVSAMVKVQFFCGMRPQDVCRMRPIDIDQSGEIWLYRPPKHKNAWRGHVLVKGIPKVAQVELVPFLDRDDEKPLFSPSESRQWWLDNGPRKERKTKRYPSEVRRLEEKKRRRRRKKKSANGDQYVGTSYSQAVRYAIEKARKAGAEVESWSPNQLRHGIATELAAAAGQQKAQRWLGHKNLSTTSIYVEQQESELLTIAEIVDCHFGQS